MKINFLHISDIHCGYNNYTVSNMREKMSSDISKFISEKNQKIDYIFITGDLKYGKNNPDTYPESTLEFIQTLQRSFNVKAENTFVVPGNHDLTRGFIRDAAIRNMKENYSSLNGIINVEYLNALFPTIDKFKEIYKNICGRTYEKNHFYLDVGSFNIIHLNTALICGEQNIQNEDGSLILGMSLLKEALNGMDISKPAIVLAHHSFDCFTTTEQAELEKLLKSKNAILYLCGHKHVSMISNVAVAEKDKPLHQFLCGTNMDKDPYLDRTDMDIAVGMFDTDTYVGYFDIYKWSFKKSGWMPDSEFSFAESHTTDGRIYYPSKSDCLSSEAVKTYIHYLECSCSDIQLDGLPVDGYVGSKKFPLDMLYVPIRFQKKLSSQEEFEEWHERFYYIDRFSYTKNSKETNTISSPIQEEVFNSIILAGPGNGKTTFLKKVVSYYSYSYSHNKFLESEEGFVKNKLLPIWIKCRTLNERTDFSMINIIKDIPSFAEFPPDEELKQAFYDIALAKITNGEAIILIDGLDEISDYRKRNSFIEQIDTFSSSYKKSRIIITSRIAGYEDYNKSGLSGFKNFQIQPFNNEDIRKLCVKWHTAVINDLEQTVIHANKLADVIIKHDRIRALATNPLLLTTLLLVQRRVGRLPTKRVALYDESIKVLIETWNQEGHEPLDSSSTWCKLAYIAFSMSVKGVQQITKDELITILHDANDDMKRILTFDTDSPEQFIKRTEQRSSLLIKVGYAKDNNEILHEIYEFQHLTFQEYLTSFAIVKKYYPHAKRTDRTIDILLNINGLNAFDPISKKEEVVLLTAALSGWDAEDIALALIDKIQNSEKNFSDISRLSIMLVLDDLELETETVENLLTLSLSQPSEYALSVLEELWETKYKDTVKKSLKETFLDWIKLQRKLAYYNLFEGAPTILDIWNIDKNFSKKIIDKMEKTYSADSEGYEALSYAVLEHISNHPNMDKDIAHPLIKKALLNITIQKIHIVKQLLNIGYTDIIQKAINDNNTDWIITTALNATEMSELIWIDKSFLKKIKQKIENAYINSENEYDKLSYFCLRLFEMEKIPEELVTDLFKLSCKNITSSKAKNIIDLFHGKYASILRKTAEGEFADWINGSKNMSPSVHILDIIKNFTEKDIIKFFLSHVDGNEKSVIEAIQAVDVFYWYKDIKNVMDNIALQQYWDFIWNCMEDNRTAVNEAALISLATHYDETMSLSQTKKIINTLCKIMKNRQLDRSTLYLYCYFQIEQYELESNDISEANKQMVLDVLSHDFSEMMKTGAFIFAVIHKLISYSQIRELINNIKLDEFQKEKINQLIAAEQE